MKKEIGIHSRKKHTFSFKAHHPGMLYQNSNASVLPFSQIKKFLNKWAIPRYDAVSNMMDKWRFPLKILQHLKYPFKTYSHSSYGFSFFLVHAIFIPSRLDWRTFLSVLTTHCAIQVNDLLTFGSSNISIFLPKLITILLIIWPLLPFSGSRAGSKWQWHWPISSGPKLHSRCPRSQV